MNNLFSAFITKKKGREKRESLWFPKTFHDGLGMWLIAENNNTTNTRNTSGNIYFTKKGPEGRSFQVNGASVS